MGGGVETRRRANVKTIVSIKQVPARDSLLRVDAQGRWIDAAGLEFEMNEPDAYALEAALQLKEQHGGEVIALCAGPEGAARTLREALAKGADRAIHVETEDLREWGAFGVARLLAEAARPEMPDLILTGLESGDLGFGQTGVIVAELLGLPHSTIIMKIEAEGGRLRVKRELEGGWFQFIELPLPAVLTIQSGISKLRYATLMGIKKARSKEIRRITAASLGAAPERTFEVTRLYAPERSRQTEMIEGDARTMAAALIDKLRFEARVL